MSQTTYRHTRLDAHYARLIQARHNQNPREQRTALNLMILDCWGLHLGIGDFLAQKSQQEAATQLGPTANGLGIDAMEVDGKPQHRCPGCGEFFGSKQARGAHSKFCKKGGSHD